MKVFIEEFIFYGLISIGIILGIICLLWKADDLISDIKYKFSKKLSLKLAENNESLLDKFLYNIYKLILKVDNKIYYIYKFFGRETFKISSILASIIITYKYRTIIIDWISNFYNTEIKKIIIFNWSIVLDNRIINNKLLWILISLFFIKKYYKTSLRRGYKEKYYKDVIDEYLKLKDLILEIIFINIENEKILYRIIKYNNDELKAIDKKYNRKLYNFLNKDTFNEQYLDLEKDIEYMLPNIKELLDYNFNKEELLNFKELYWNCSRWNIIRSIDKKLSNLFLYFEPRNICIIGKEEIIKQYMINIGNIKKLLEQNVIKSVTKRIEFLDMIKKTDKRIGLYKRENWRDDINRKI